LIVYAVFFIRYTLSTMATVLRSNEHNTFLFEPCITAYNYHPGNSSPSSITPLYIIYEGSTNTEYSTKIT